MFSRPVRCLWKFGSSTIAPTRASAAARLSGSGHPSILMVPASGCVSPSSIRISVVFPAPLWPRNPNAQPRGTVRSRSITAGRLPKLLPSPRVSMMFVVVVMAHTVGGRGDPVIGHAGDQRLRRAGDRA